jgi:hypothetical protein
MILEQARDSLGEGWLCRPKDQEWSLDTQCEIADLDSLSEDQLNADGLPAYLVEAGLVPTLDTQTIKDIVSGASQLQNPPTIETLFEAFLYYYEFDAFLPRIGAPDPPSAAEILGKLDREFYDSLGPERGNVQCRDEHCTRGAVWNSVFCRVHHFEMVKKRPCPFRD